ncbi:Major facilitator superfamily domain-containing protein 6 [Trichinella patagoniensis]|uniref:Major facilitator superfamily domain-containing protein 6 n=1 Tax=Trichinella patagoniensis TaxID=990121 RepID=A0A0V0Z9U5_9BILA|nr:Major facilitator superfamily domain-containing protein 6 [Trichinella patagoniensis]
MLLTAILVVIILALIYHFVTEKKQISEWKETRVQPMTAIPEKKTPEEIIKESKELQLKADKKQVGKTKKKTKSKKSKKAIKSIPKGTDISKEKTETDKKIEMAESSPEKIKAVAATRNIIPQIVPNVATEEITKAAEKIRREDSEKKKRKLKRKSKSKKGREMENEMSVKKDMMSTEKSETKLRTEVTPFQLQNMAQYMEEQNIMGQVVAQRDFKQLTKVAEKIKKTDSKKRNSKSAKRSKSTKTKKEETEMMEEKDTSSRKHKSKMEDEIMQWTPEIPFHRMHKNRTWAACVVFLDEKLRIVICEGVCDLFTQELKAFNINLKLSIKCNSRLTHAAVWAAATSYISLATPPQFKSSAQGLLQGLHHGLGRGCGALFGGLIITYTGTQLMFRAYGFSCLVILGIFYAVNRFMSGDGIKYHSEAFLDEQHTLAPHGIPMHVPFSPKSEKLLDSGAAGFYGTVDPTQEAYDRYVKEPYDKPVNFEQLPSHLETRVQPMTAIPEKKTPEEIIKESKELQLKEDKKQVEKTKKKTKSKKSKKAIKSIPKGTDISIEKTETDKKIEMAESSPETIKAVAATRNIIPQIVPNVATEEITKAAEKIRREDSEKKKRKLKRKSKSKKGREMENEMSVKKDMMSTEKSETKLRTEVTPFQLQNMAQYMEEQNIMGQVVAQRDFKQLTKVAEKIKKTDSKKRNSKSAKRSKSTKTKKEETEMMEEKDTSSRKHKSKMEDEIMQWTPEVRAEATESNRLIDGMCRTRLSEKEKKVKERIAEQESRKEKKKSKNKSKSNKSKKGEITKAPITTEITEAVRDKTDIVQPITDEKTPDEFIKEKSVAPLPFRFNSLEGITGQPRSLLDCMVATEWRPSLSSASCSSRKANREEANRVFYFWRHSITHPKVMDESIFPASCNNLQAPFIGLSGVIILHFAPALSFLLLAPFHHTVKSHGRIHFSHILQSPSSPIYRAFWGYNTSFCTGPCMELCVRQHFVVLPI